MNFFIILKSVQSKTLILLLHVFILCTIHTKELFQRSSVCHPELSENIRRYCVLCDLEPNTFVSQPHEKWKGCRNPSFRCSGEFDDFHVILSSDFEFLTMGLPREYTLLNKQTNKKKKNFRSRSTIDGKICEHT